MNKLGNEYKMKYVTKVRFGTSPGQNLRGKSLPSWPKDMGHRNLAKTYLIHIERNI